MTTQRCAMTLTGTVMNGVVVFDGGPVPVEGTKVAIEIRPAAAVGSAPTGDEPKGTLAFLLKYAGTVPDLPPDFAAQHDHYIHGTPKR
jgi:hypothetical protein